MTAFNRKSTIILTLIFLLAIFLPTAISDASRPDSIDCPFQGELLQTIKTTDEDNHILRYDLKLKITTIESQAECHQFKDIQTITGTWYPPVSNDTSDQKLTQVEFRNMITPGATLSGAIDSYDLIIKNLTLIEAAPADSTPIPSETQKEMKLKDLFFLTPLAVIGLAIFGINKLGPK